MSAPRLSFLLSLVILPGILFAQGPFIAYEVDAGTAGNQDFGGALGMEFEVEFDIAVTRLGVFDDGSNGLSLPITARIYDRDTLEILVEMLFEPGDDGELVGGSRFKELDEELDLPAGFRGTIVASGYGAAERNGNMMGGPLNPRYQTNGGECAIRFVGSALWGMDPNAYPTNVDGGPANRYAAGTFEFVQKEKPVQREAIAYVVPDMTFGNQAFGGPLGMDFDVRVDIRITRLGVFDSGADGLSLPITATLYNRDSRCAFASIEFTPDDPGEPEGGSVFKKLAEPLGLPAGFRGTIVAEGYGDSEMNGNGTLGQETDTGGCAIVFVGGGRYGVTPGEFPGTLDTHAVPNPFAAGTFEFGPAPEPVKPPEPPTDLAAAPEAEDSVRLTWKAPAAGPAVSGYNVYQTRPGALTKLNDDAIAELEWDAAGLTSCVEACFVVRSVYAGCLESADSEEVCAKPIDPEPTGGIAYIVPEGTFGNQAHGGPLGMDFDVLKEIEVIQLGVFDDGSNGLFLPITARLYDRDTIEVLAEMLFEPGDEGELVGGSRFKELDEPVVLPAGFHGTIVAVGYGVGEQNGNQGPGWADLGTETNHGGCLLAFVGGARWGPAGAPDVFPGNLDGGPADRYAAGTFEYQPFAPPTGKFVRGDVDANDSMTIGDGVWTLNYLFASGAAPPCLDAADFNDDGQMDIGDGISLLNYLFAFGAAPRPPFPDCGPDPTTADGFSCDRFPPCR